jgi:hypothetical protein
MPSRFCSEKSLLCVCVSEGMRARASEREREREREYTCSEKSLLSSTATRATVKKYSEKSFAKCPLIAKYSGALTFENFYRNIHLSRTAPRVIVRRDPESCSFRI